jgi:hypothetical protein
MRRRGLSSRADQENIGHRFNPTRAAAFLVLSVQEVAASKPAAAGDGDNST